MKSFYFINLAMFLSIFSIIFVFVLQYEYGILPCKICIWQRWPHVINIFLVLIILSSNLIPNYIYKIALINMFFGFLLALYHFGLEQKIWNNVFSCSGTLDLKNLSAGELLTNLNNTPITSCEIQAWNFLKLSLTGWNIISTLLISVIWFIIIKHNKINYDNNSASQ